MATSHLLVAALALVLLIVAGSADASCAKGFKDCDGRSWNGCETNVYTDPYNCAYCNHACKTYPHMVTKCDYGVCKWVCNYLYGDCDRNIQNGCETYLGYDVHNCGYCGHVCKLSPDYKYGEVFCSEGKCKSQCPAGWSYNKPGKYCYK